MEHKKNLSIHFIDVGYGDAILIRFPDDGNILIDGGSKDEGDHVVEYLKNLGIKKLDFVVSTHPHWDHIEGLLIVLDKMEVGEVYTADFDEENEKFMELIEITENKGIPLTAIERGDILYRGFDIIMDVFHPVERYEDLNDESIVLKLSYGDTKFLLAGDIGSMVQDELIELYFNKLRADVLKLPHHGNGLSDEFLECVSPEFAVLTIGPNIYEAPSNEVLNRVINADIVLKRTDVDGDIVFTSDGKNVKIVNK